MPMLTEIIDGLSNSFRVLPTTVREQARVLRDAGYMTKQQRRRGGGNMSVADATNLLLATAGTSNPARSRFPVEGHGECTPEDGAWLLPFEGLPKIRNLPADHKLADLLAGLLSSVVEGEIDGNHGSIKLPHSNQLIGEFYLDVTLREPLVETAVTMGIRELDEHQLPVIRFKVEKLYRQRFFVDGMLAVPGFQPDAFDNSDLTHQHSFSHRVILDLGQILRR